MDKEFLKNPASFRDNDGFVFRDQSKKYYRQLNISYSENYNFLMNSGLYKKLADSGKLISHEEVANVVFEKENHFKTILPEQIPFISYPYEWCFDQLRDSALLTLDAMKISLEHGMILKDAIPFNVQFFKGKNIFIDSSSFEKYETGKPWIAYKQFCETFLAPLLLMSYCHPEMNKLLLPYPDGIPLKMASNLLPWRTYFKSSALFHIHFHANSGKNKSVKRELNISKQRLHLLIDNLKTGIENLEIRSQKTEWQNYYSETILSGEYLDEKKKIVKEMVNKLSVSSAIDIGCNDGIFSLMPAEKNIRTIAIDSETSCINSVYEICKSKNIKNIYPLVIDISNPSPAIGWNNSERTAFIERCKSELVLALAVVHHLAIGKNISFEMMAELFSTLGKYLIIEFVPKSDEKVQKMLQNRKDIFNNYNQEYFEQTFLKYFLLVNKKQISNTERVIYHFEKIVA